MDKNTTSPSPPSQLFTTNLHNNVLTLNNVVLKDTYVLRRIELTNLCDAPLNINIQSDLGEQIGFQLDNENLQDGFDGPLQADDFNQVFIFSSFNTLSIIF